MFKCQVPVFFAFEKQLKNMGISAENPFLLLLFLIHDLLDPDLLFFVC